MARQTARCAPNLRRFCITDPAESVSVVPCDSFVCLITQGHGTDLPILKELLRQEHRYPYIGMIGSDTKALKVRKALRVDGFTEEQIAELHSPIGLSIGTNHQTEIAISIIANCFKFEIRYNPKIAKSESLVHFTLGK